MYLYFDRSGVLKEIINDIPARVGSQNWNKIYAYFEGFEEYTITGAWIKYYLPTGEYYEQQGTIEIPYNNHYSGSSKLEIPFDKKRDLKFFEYYKKYEFYEFNVPAGVLALTGGVGIEISFVNNNGTQTTDDDVVYEMGMGAIQVEGNGVGFLPEEHISIAQWNVLKTLISNSSISNMVTIDTNQTITGDKNFTGALKKNNVNVATTDDIATHNSSSQAHQDIRNAIPTKTSDITNDSGFITNAVNNLVNYYLKSETYTKQEVQTLISAIEKIEFVVVSVLPTASASTMNKIYLVPSTHSASQNVKDEFITLRSGSEGAYTYAWEQIGSTAIDLSNYVTTNTNQYISGDKNFAGNTILNSGKAIFWGDGAYGVFVKVANGLTDDVEITLPDEDGTLATTSDLEEKQDTLTAGLHVSLENNVVSIVGGVYREATSINSPLCFTAVSSNSSVGYSKIGSIVTSGIQKSTDGITWESWDGTSVSLVDIGDKFYVKNTNNTLNIDSSNRIYFTMSGRIGASGNINSMINYSNLSAYCYYYLFNGCTSLATAPSLPATTMATYCYASMFRGCTSLATAPSLPATTLAGYCYSAMFYGCTSLTTIPNLPATTLVEYCYTSMFYRCTSLYISDTQTEQAGYVWKIPETSVTSIESYDFGQSDMFVNCLGTRSSDSMAGGKGNSYTYYTQNDPISSSSENVYLTNENDERVYPRTKADLVDDSSSTNKFTTTAEKNTWNAKQDRFVIIDGTLGSDTISLTNDQIQMANNYPDKVIFRIPIDQNQKVLCYYNYNSTLSLSQKAWTYCGVGKQVNCSLSSQNALRVSIIEWKQIQNIGTGLSYNTGTDQISVNTSVIATQTDLTTKQSQTLTGTTAPTTSTVGVVGQFYLNTTDNKLYICTVVSGSTYTWVETSGGGGSANAVLYTEQTLTAEQKTQARTNIGASSVVIVDWS